MSESIWKKEIRLRKRKDAEPKVEAAAPAPAPEAADESTSVWKKEVRLRKRPEPLPPLPAHLLDRSRGREERPRGTVVVPVVPGASEPLQRVERWTARVPAPRTQFPLPSAAGEGEDPVALLPRERATDPAPHNPEPPAAPPTVEPEADTLVMPALTAEPAPEPVAPALPFALPPTPTPAVEAPIVPPEPPAREPEPVAPALPFALPPTPTPAVETLTVRAEPPAPEPEPALMADVEPDPEPVASEQKVPLLKREIHLGRKQRAPKEPKAKKEPRAKKEPKLKREANEEKVPLLKREVRLGRKRKGATAPVTASAAAVEAPAPTPPAQKVPLLKRELKLGRPKRQAARTANAAADHKVARVVGLRIGSTQLAAAHLRNNGSAEVVQLARMPLDRGLIVGGEVREPVALAKALKAFFAANKLPKKDIRLGVASNRIGVRLLDVPAVGDPKQFENAIRFRAQELLPIPIVDAVLDYVIVGEEVGDEGETIRRVLLVFAHRELVSTYVDVCRQAGLRLAGIDLDAFALLRAIGPQADNENRRASVAVAIGHERTVFAVSDGELCAFTRVFEWGSNVIDVAIARALNLSPSQAEPLKVELDLAASEPPAGLSPMQFEVARSAVTGEIGHLVRELLSSLRFYQSQPDSLDLHEVVLSGGGAELRGLAAEVQRGLGVPVRIGDPFERVSLAKRVKVPEGAGSFAVAVGLGIEA